MANTNPGGVDFNTSPYFDDYNEDKKFVRVLFRPGRAVQARELTQMQTLQQDQMRRFATYFFNQGAVVDGCEQNLDLNLPYVKLQPLFNGTEVEVEDFNDEKIFGANSGVIATVGLVSDVDSVDPKTLFINYLSSGCVILTIDTLPSTFTPGNTITFSTGNSATIEAGYTDPLTGTYKLYVSNTEGTLTVTSANTIDDTGATISLNVTAVVDRTSNTVFDDNEIVFTSNYDTRVYANTASSRATYTIVNEGLATEQRYDFGSKYSIADGYVYIADHFVKNTNQTIILDKYTNEPSYKIGIVPQKSFVDYIEDPTLVDNAQGTPNFLAPGADRFKINTVLTKVALGESTDENEFITLTEIEEGVAKKRKPDVIEGKLEEAIAKRTFEESGDYTLNDPRLNVREHLLQDNNGGRYTSEDGGNNELLLFEIDPFTSYVSGFRNELIVRTQIDVRKGLDTEYIEQTKTQINYGYYVEVNELVGSWDFMEATKIDLLDVESDAISNASYSATSVDTANTKIGEARVRAVEYVSGTQGGADARYYIYLYEIEMNAGKVFSQVKGLYDSATPARFADIVSGTAVVQEPAFNTLIFQLPYDAIRTIRDEQDQVETGFRFRKKYSVSFTNGVATISTSDPNETFVGTDVLNNTQKNNFYGVIINNAGSDVETANLTGTISIGAGTNIVSGAGTAFETELNVGDFIYTNSEEGRVLSIANDVYLTLDDNHTAGASGDTYTKILKSGSLIPLDKNGGTGGTRVVNVTSPGTVQINIKESTALPFSAEVITTMDRANAREKRKTLNFQTQANINANTHPNGIGGPFGLGYADIFQLHSIWQSDSFDNPAVVGAASNTNVTSGYTLYNGQTENSYDHGYIIPKSGVTPTGRLLVVFDYFSHDTTQGLGYCSVDSYPVNDLATSNTTINTTEISTFTTASGETFDLRDCIDFRPVKVANTSLNPLDNVAYSIPSGGLHIPVPSSDFDADLIYYKGRVAKIYINNRGIFGINDGVPKSAGSKIAAPPPKLPDTLEIAEITIPPYPSRPIDVGIRPLRNRRFTMKDISNLNERVKKLEYYTALGFLEKQATDKVELDDVGLDRFKNGILTDPFNGHGVADVLNGDYRAAISRKERYVTSYQDNGQIADLVYDASASRTLRTIGNKVLMPWLREETFAEQPYASRQLNLAEELTFTWIGNMNIVPATDNWIQTTRDPSRDIVYDDSGISDNMKSMVDAWNTEVAPLNLNWTGEPVEEVIGDTDVEKTRVRSGRTTTITTVTSGFVQTSQDAYFNLATFQQSAPQRQASDRVVDVSFINRMRSRDFIVEVNGLKNNSKLYAFFDGVDVTKQCVQIELVGASTIQSVFDLLDANNLCIDGAIGTLDGVATTRDASIYRVVSTVGDLRAKNNRILLVFRVPVDSFDVGSREFKLTDSPTNFDGTTTTFAKKSVFAQGISQVKSQTVINSRPFSVDWVDETARESVGRQVRSLEYREISTNVQVVRHDPVSQSFYVDEATYRNGCFLTSIDLYFRTKSDDPNLGATVEIREMFNGFPTRKIIGGEVARIENAAINVSEDSSLPTTAYFTNPVYLQPGYDYCFTVKPDANSTDFTIWVAELGGIDITNPEIETRIDKQPAAGVVFTSSDDYTWSVRQNIDIKFKMKVAFWDVNTPAVAYWNNINVDTSFKYAGFTPMLEDVVLSETNIAYQVRLADETYTVSDFFPIKNYERRLLLSPRQITNSSLEALNDFKSATLLATLSTTDPYVSPYVDDERITLAFERNIINNSTETVVDGTIQFTSGNNYVVGVGTDFANDVFAGEYANFGDEYRRISSIANSTYLTVATNFTTSNTVNQQLIIRSEENPSGPYSSETRYITRIVTLNDGFEAADLTAYLNINRPAGTAIKVYAKVLNENDTDVFNDKFYLEMSLEGTETFTQNPSVYREEKYVLPAGVKTGGAELLAGNVSISTASTDVVGNGTRFLEDLRIGDTIAVGVTRAERVVQTIANNTYLTVESAFASTDSAQDIFKVLNNTISYTTPDGRTFEGFKYFAVKIVFLSSNEAYAPKVKDLRVIALA